MLPLCIQGKEIDTGAESIRNLLKAVDDYIPTPQRDLDKPFMMAVESTYTIQGKLQNFLKLCLNEGANLV